MRLASNRRLFVGFLVVIILSQLLSRQLFLKFPAPSGIPPAGYNSNIKPVISFIIPSTLTRVTLKRTIKSLQRQTIPHWEAIVGVDLRTAPFSPLEDFATTATQKNYDPRVRIVPIMTESDDRGESPHHNGAGAVRNAMMQKHAKADWVAFCDDDDTLSPYYIEYWQQGLKNLASKRQKADILIFRMKDKKFEKDHYKGILPPPSHGPVASLISVGISFAVRRAIVSNRTSAAEARHNNLPMLKFVAGQAEDFYFLLKAQEVGARIGQTCCVGYYVRSAPPVNERHKAFCRWEKAYIIEAGFRYVKTLGPPLFNETKIVPCPTQ